MLRNVDTKYKMSSEHLDRTMKRIRFEITRII